MRVIFCVATLLALSATAVSSYYVVQADDNKPEMFDDRRQNECKLRTQKCRKQMVTRVTDEDIRGLCSAKPLETTSTKCMMDCQMLQFGWLDMNGTFHKDKYLDFMKESKFGYDFWPNVEAAESAADVCKDEKASFDDSCETAYIILKCLQNEGDKQQKTNIGYALFYVDP